MPDGHEVDRCCDRRGCTIVVNTVVFHFCTTIVRRARCACCVISCRRQLIASGLDPDVVLGAPYNGLGPLLPPSNWSTYRIPTELHVEVRAVNILSADRSLLVSCLCEMAGRWADSLCVSRYVQMTKLSLGSRILYFVPVTDGH